MYPNVDLSIQRSHQCKPVLCMAIAAWMLVDLCWCQEQQEGMLAAGEVLRAGATAWTAAGEAPAACHRPPRRCARREAVREAVVQEVRPPGETREEARAAEGPEERQEEAPEAAQAGRQAGARARVDDAGGDGRDLERGRPAGGVSRRLGRLALEETLHGDAGHALVHGLRATVVIETLETNLAGTGGVPRRSAGAARTAVGAAVDAVDAANARPARVVVRGVGVVAPAVPATPRGLAHGRTPVARRRVVVGGRGTGKCVLMVLLDGQYVFA